MKNNLHSNLKIHWYERIEIKIKASEWSDEDWNYIFSKQLIDFCTDFDGIVKIWLNQFLQLIKYESNRLNQLFAIDKKRIQSMIELDRIRSIESVFCKTKSNRLNQYFPWLKTASIRLTNRIIMFNWIEYFHENLSGRLCVAQRTWNNPQHYFDITRVKWIDVTLNLHQCHFRFNFMLNPLDIFAGSDFLPTE